MNNDIVAEQATGCVARVQNGGTMYSDNGNPLSNKAARKIFRDGGNVEVPNAGAGSYKTILQRLGFKKISVDNWSSSAGDWSFLVQGKRIVFQENRYPYHGFRYSMFPHHECEN